MGNSEQVTIEPQQDEERPTIQGSGRHWFVAGPCGYCQACGLPQANSRVHAPRPDAA